MIRITSYQAGRSTLGGQTCNPYDTKRIMVIGFLSPGTPETRPATLAAVRRGLAEAGFVEGRNVSIQYRWAGDETDRLEVLAAELVRLNVRVIIALGGERGALAAKSATTSIPIVFGLAGDPTDIDLVQSLNRPGRNLTGATTLSIEAAAKSMELLHELIPSVAVIALLVDQAYAGESRAQVEEAGPHEKCKSASPVIFSPSLVTKPIERIQMVLLRESGTTQLAIARQHQPLISRSPKRQAKRGRLPRKMMSQGFHGARSQTVRRYARAGVFLPPRTVAIGNRRCLPLRVPL